MQITPATVITHPGDVDLRGVDTVDGDEETSLTTGITSPPPSSKKRSISETCDSSIPSSSVGSKEKKNCNDGHHRQMAAKRLTVPVPFCTTTRMMTSDHNIGIIQNNAAIVATAALKCFAKDVVVKTFEISKREGRNFIKYDDVAEARAAERTLSLFDLLTP